MPGPLQVASPALVAVGAYLLAGVVAGLFGAVVMDFPMNRQPEGWTPAFVAAAVVWRVRPDDVPFRRASLLHHAAGGLAGLLHGLVLAALAALLPAGPTFGVPVLPHLLAVAAVTAFVYLFFAHLVLPRAARRTYEERATAVRGQWLRSTLVFAAALAVAAPPLAGLVRAVLGA